MRHFPLFRSVEPRVTALAGAFGLAGRIAGVAIVAVPCVVGRAGAAEASDVVGCGDASPGSVG
jgi:hypothetical protein